MESAGGGDGDGAGAGAGGGCTLFGAFAMGLGTPWLKNKSLVRAR